MGFKKAKCLHRLILALFLFTFGFRSIVFGADNRVLTSIYPVYIVAKEIAQSVCDVENLIPPGSSPHDYQIRPGDIVKVQRASLVFVCGLGLDGWFESAIRKSTGSKMPQCFPVTTGIEPFLIYEPASDNERDRMPNPHFWLDPVLMKFVATNVAVKLKGKFPEKYEMIEENLKNFAHKMDSLDTFINSELSKVKKRPVFCLHNAFAYFGKRYGIEIAGIIEDVPDLPVSPQRLAKLISIARQKQVCVVFGEIGVAGDVAKRLADELKLPFATLDTIETADESGASYEERMKKNAIIIRKSMER